LNPFHFLITESLPTSGDSVAGFCECPRLVVQGLRHDILMTA
jgi:hypothetical protein